MAITKLKLVSTAIAQTRNIKVEKERKKYIRKGNISKIMTGRMNVKFQSRILIDKIAELPMFRDSN